MAFLPANYEYNYQLMTVPLLACSIPGYEVRLCCGVTLSSPALLKSSFHVSLSGEEVRSPEVRNADRSDSELSHLRGDFFHAMFCQLVVVFFRCGKA